MKSFFKFGLVLVFAAAFLVGCSSTPGVVRTTPVATLGTYQYGQVPDQRQLEYRGPAYKDHLRRMQAEGMAHEEDLAQLEYRVKLEIAKAQLKKQAASNGVNIVFAPTPTNPQQAQSPVAPQVYYAPPQTVPYTVPYYPNVYGGGYYRPPAQVYYYPGGRTIVGGHVEQRKLFGVRFRAVVRN